MPFTGSSMWSLGIVVSTALVALSSPLLGIIADRVPIKMALLWVYTVVGALFTVLMFFSAYTARAWMLGMLVIPTSALPVVWCSTTPSSPTSRPGTA